MKRLQAAEKFIGDTLYEFGFPTNVVLSVISAYRESNRTYHNAIHILEMYEYAIRVQVDGILSQDEWKAFLLAIIFHDVVYDTKSHTNEEDSYTFFVSSFEQLTAAEKDNGKWVTILSMVEIMILTTKLHNFTPQLPLYVQYIIKADLERLTLSFPDFWNNTKQLMKEYAFVDWAIFKEGRLKFFEGYRHKVIFMGQQAVDNITMAHAALSVWEPKIAIFAGSFDPFTYGHERVVSKLDKIFDKVIIARGVNTSKPPHTFEIPKEIATIYQIDSYSGSLAAYLDSKPYPVTLVRGIRNTVDLASENILTRWLHDKKKNVQILYMPTDPDVEHVSSTLAREERKFNGNIKTEYEI